MTDFKRIIIMSPDSTNLGVIERTVSDYFRENFSSSERMGIYSITKNYEEGNVIGSGGEILGIFDWFYEPNGTTLAKTSRAVLRDKMIPYVEFEYRKVTGIDYRKQDSRERNWKGKMEVEEALIKKFLTAELKPLDEWIKYLIEHGDYFRIDLKKYKNVLNLI